MTTSTHTTTAAQLKDIEQQWFQYQKAMGEDMQRLRREEQVESTADFVESICERYASRRALEQVQIPGEAEQPWDVKMRKMSYCEMNEMANRVAWWAYEQCGVRQGDVVALLMENCNAFVCLWMGLAKIGVTVACLSTHMHGKSLEHAVSLAEKPIQHIIVSSRYLHSIPTHLQKQMFLWIWPSTDGQLTSDNGNDDGTTASLLDNMTLLHKIILQSDTFANRENPPRAWRDKITRDDPMFYIYTSGTTGRSKAARFSHQRVYGAGVTWSHHMDLTMEDRYYIALPLFHGNGGVVALAAALYMGCTSVIRQKFSASRFIDDLRQYNCTATIYIGEIWRYICNQPHRSDDFHNPLRVAAGNGLSTDVWKEVEERFGVQQIVEHYGQTEMISAHPMINCYGRRGSCGFIPPSIWNQKHHAECLVQYDVENSTVVRDKDGFCVRCGPGEVGESLVDIQKTCGQYRGYTRAEESAKKVYHNVFSQGDSYFHSGDLLRYDEDGFFYFVDRIGDTFRWKGENVATNEVAEVVERVEGILEANVYGVSVPGNDGRAGMASIVMQLSDDKQLSNVLQRLYSYTAELLPSHALPLFLRVRRQQNITTATFKFQKFQYQREGIDPQQVKAQGDLLFVRLANDGKYATLDDSILEQIRSAKIRL